MGCRGLWFEGVEIHDRVHTWTKKVDEEEEKVTSDTLTWNLINRLTKEKM